MKAKSIYILSIVTLLLAAFTGPAFAATGTANLSTSTLTATGSSMTALSASYSPQPGDVNLTRDKVFIDFTKSRLLISATRPVSVQAVLVGNLPDPCHVLRVVVDSTSLFNNINISVYSLFKPGTACATVLQPFSVTVPLGSFTSGSYTVNVNGTKLGSFSVGSAITATVNK